MNPRCLWKVSAQQKVRTSTSNADFSSVNNELFCAIFKEKNEWAFYKIQFLLSKLPYLNLFLDVREFFQHSFAASERFLEEETSSVKLRQGFYYNLEFGISLQVIYFSNYLTRISSNPVPCRLPSDRLSYKLHSLPRKDYWSKSWRGCVRGLSLTCLHQILRYEGIVPLISRIVTVNYFRKPETEEAWKINDFHSFQ